MLLFSAICCELGEKTFCWVIALHDCLFLISGTISGMLMACELTNEIKIGTKRNEQIVNSFDAMEDVN